jgi:phage gp36-like protein
MPLYLTRAEYLTRFGEIETVRLTDEARDGTVDFEKLDAAITGAEEIVEGYLANRYPLPLASTPELVKELVADLARERLHKDRPTPAVTEAANRARLMLRDLSAGRMTLLLEDIVAESHAPSTPRIALASNGPVFNREKLARY